MYWGGGQGAWVFELVNYVLPKKKKKKKKKRKKWWGGRQLC